MRSNVSVKEGAVLDPENLLITQRDLTLLGAFRTVAVRLIAPKPEEKKDEKVRENIIEHAEV